MDLASVEFWKAIGPAIGSLLGVLVTGSGAVIAWFVNERRKRAWEEYQRKEDRYRELMTKLRGFYVGTPDLEARQAFLDQINLCWLYCPDDVINKLYAFMATISDAKIHPDEVKERALGELVVAIREDLLKRRIAKTSSLGPSDFRPLTVLPLPPQLPR